MPQEIILYLLPTHMVVLAVRLYLKLILVSPLRLTSRKLLLFVKTDLSLCQQHLPTEYQGPGHLLSITWQPLHTPLHHHKDNVQIQLP